MPQHPFDLRDRASLDREISRKWSLHPGKIGAWVAEMDFGTAPEVTEALQRAIRDENFGYTAPSVKIAHQEATAAWQRAEYGWDIGPEHIHPVPDVMSALNVSLTKFAPAGSAVIVPTPAYMPLLTYPPTLGHPVIQVPGLRKHGRWEHDLDGIEAAFRNGAHTLVLCHPHNPTGMVATRKELNEIASIVDTYGGRVFSDEIHSPLTYPGLKHIPYASISPTTASHTITATSTSKAWNTPGLKSAQLITSNASDFETYERFGFSIVHGASTFGILAGTAAYTHGKRWLSDTLQYVENNRNVLATRITNEFPEAAFHAPEATYIAWIDFSSSDMNCPADFFRDTAGVVLTNGALCGSGYKDWVRFIFAMPRPVLETALTAMRDAIDAHSR